MQFLINYKLTLAGIVIGAIAGYLYYLYVGCASGSCAITSNPVNSTLYGAIMGGLLLDTFRKQKTVTHNKKEKDENKNNN